MHHHMSFICCRKSHHTTATLAPAHTPCLFSIDLHSEATAGESSFSSVYNSIPNNFMCAPSLSSKYRLETIVSLTLDRLNFLFDHCKYVHDLGMSLICLQPFVRSINVRHKNKKFKLNTSSLLILMHLYITLSMLYLMLLVYLSLFILPFSFALLLFIKILLVFYALSLGY